MSQISSNLDILRGIPGYKVILRALIKAQIQLLVQQLSDQTGEESVILTASVNDGTLTHLGSEKAKGFYEGRYEVKEQFFGYLTRKLPRTSSNGDNISHQNEGPLPKKQKLYSVMGVRGNTPQTRQNDSMPFKKTKTVGPGQRNNHGPQVWTPSVQRKQIYTNNRRPSAPVSKYSTNRIASELCNDAVPMSKHDQASLPRLSVVSISKHTKVSVPRHDGENEDVVIKDYSQEMPGDGSKVNTRASRSPKIKTVEGFGVSNQAPQQLNPMTDAHASYPELTVRSENSESLKNAFNLTKPIVKQVHVPSPPPLMTFSHIASSGADQTSDFHKTDVKVQDETAPSLTHGLGKPSASNTNKPCGEVTNTVQNTDLNSVSATKNHESGIIDSGITSDTDTVASITNDIYGGDISVGAGTDIDISTTDDCRSSAVTASTPLTSNNAVTSNSTDARPIIFPDDKLAMLNGITAELDAAKTVTLTTYRLDNDRITSTNTDMIEVKDTSVGTHHNISTELDDSSVKTTMAADSFGTDDIDKGPDIKVRLRPVVMQDANVVTNRNVSPRTDNASQTASSMDLFTTDVNPSLNPVVAKENEVANELEIASKVTDNTKPTEIVKVDKSSDFNSKTSFSPDIQTGAYSYTNADINLTVPMTDSATCVSADTCLTRTTNIAFGTDSETRDSSSGVEADIAPVTFPNDTFPSGITGPDTKTSDSGFEIVNNGLEIKQEDPCTSKTTFISLDVAATTNIDGVEVEVAPVTYTNTAVDSFTKIVNDPITAKSSGHHYTGSETEAHTDTQSRKLTDVDLRASVVTKAEETKTINNPDTTANVLDSVLNDIVSSTAYTETCSLVEGTHNSVASIVDNSEVTVPKKDSGPYKASTENYINSGTNCFPRPETDTANVGFNTYSLLNGTMVNSGSGGLTNDNASGSTCTSYERAPDLVASSTILDKLKTNSDLPVYMHDENSNITSYVKAEPDKNKMLERMENLELQPMKTGCLENMAVKTSESLNDSIVDTNLDVVQRETTGNVMAEVSNNTKGDTIIVEILEPAMDEEIDDGVRQLLPPGTVIMGSELGSQYILGDNFDANKIVGRPRGRPRKRKQDIHMKASDSNPISPFVRQTVSCSEVAFVINKEHISEEQTTVENPNYSRVYSENQNKMYECSHKDSGIVNKNSKDLVSPKVYRISLFGRKTENTDSDDTNQDSDGRKQSKLKETDLKKPVQNTISRNVSKEVVFEEISKRLNDDKSKDAQVNNGVRDINSKTVSKEPLFKELCKEYVDSKSENVYLNNEGTVEKHTARKESKQVVRGELAEESICSKSDDTNASYASVQNASQPGISIESVSKDLYKDSVDTKLKIANVIDNGSVQESSPLLNQRKGSKEPVLKESCDDSVCNKSTDTDLNNNNSVQNTKSETVCKKPVFEGSNNESNYRNSIKSRLKSNDNVENTNLRRLSTDNTQNTNPRRGSTDNIENTNPRRVLTDNVENTNPRRGSSDNVEITNPRRVSTASAYEALFKESVISDGLKTYGSDFLSKHPEFSEALVKKDLDLIDNISIKQETNTEIDDLACSEKYGAYRGSETSRKIFSDNGDKDTKCLEELPLGLDENDLSDITPGNDLHSQRTKILRKRKINDGNSLTQKEKETRKSRNKIPKRLSVKNVPGNALFANFCEPTEVYTKPISRKSSETIVSNVSALTDDVDSSTGIKKEPEEHFNISSPKNARGKRICHTKDLYKQSQKKYPSQVSSLSEAVELKRSAKLNKSLSGQTSNKIKIESVGANDSKVPEQISVELSDTTKEKFLSAGLKVSEKGWMKTRKSTRIGAKSDYIKEAIASGSLFICDDCGKWFQFRSHLENHRLVHTGDLPYMCLVCFHRFRMKHEIKRHTLMIHPEVTHFKDLEKSQDFESVS